MYFGSVLNVLADLVARNKCIQTTEWFSCAHHYHTLFSKNNFAAFPNFSGFTGLKITPTHVLSSASILGDLRDLFALSHTSRTRCN